MSSVTSAPKKEIVVYGKIAVIRNRERIAATATFNDADKEMPQRDFTTKYDFKITNNLTDEEFYELKDKAFEAVKKYDSVAKFRRAA